MARNVNRARRRRSKADSPASREPRAARGSQGGSVAESWRPLAVFDRALHLREESEPVWKFFPLVLALAFAVRAAVALSGDFLLHPDEVMQYLEPAHRLVFGNGITFWEFFYGARSWLIPGFVAGILKAFDLVGLGEPRWYVGGVELVFCAISLAIPAAMYFFARRHFSEAAARVSLVAGAFWYELVSLAHKPMTEFVATALLLALLALCARPSLERAGTVWLCAALAVLAGAIRVQYAPLALLLLGVVFVRTEKKAQLAVATGLFVFTVGVFDGITWDGLLFHSYRANFLVNLALGEVLSEDFAAYLRPPYQYLAWLWTASAGLTALCLVAALCNLRRHAFLLALIALILLMHSAQVHKEYRFIFVVIPLGLMVGANVLVNVWDRVGHPFLVRGLAAAVFVSVSIAGILHALPYQESVHAGFRVDAWTLRYIHDHDPVFAAYRYLARNPEVKGVAHVDRGYYELAGYYHLHRKVPFYDRETVGLLDLKDPSAVSARVSHIVAQAGREPKIAGYSLDKEFGNIRILKRERNDRPVRQWQSYAPVIPTAFDALYRKTHPGARATPRSWGIRFVEPARTEAPAGVGRQSGATP